MEQEVILNLSTGAVRPLEDERLKNISEYVLSRKAQNESYRKKQQALEAAHGRHFIACTDQAIIGISKELSMAEAGFLFKILPYLTGKDGYLRQNGEYLLATDMERLSGRNRKSVGIYLSKLKSLGVIMEGEKVGKSKTYKFNQDMFTRSCAPDSYFTKLWVVNARDSKTNVKLEDLGVFLKMLPYMNTVNYTLSTNPYELENGEVDPIGLNDLAGLIGYDSKALSLAIRRLAKDNMVLLFQSGKITCTALNPYFVSRMIEPGEDTMAEGIRALVEISSASQSHE